VLLLALAGNAAPRAAVAAPAREMYAAAVSREKELRAAWEQATGSIPAASLRQVRAVVAAYEAIVRRYPTSGYCDNALWQAAALSADAFARALQDRDKRAAVRLFEFLSREYPSSPFAERAATQARRLESPAPANAPNTAKGADTSNRGREVSATRTPSRLSGESPASSSLRASSGPPSPPRESSATSLSTVRTVRRTVLAEVVRVSIELDREVPFHAERVENPARLLFDLPGTRASSSVQDANWAYQDDVVRHIRVGRHPNQTTRVVLDLDGVSRYNVVTLYNPYRILIDCERAIPVTAASAVASRRAETSPARPFPVAGMGTQTAVSPPETPRAKSRDAEKPDDPDRAAPVTADKRDPATEENPGKPAASKAAGPVTNPAKAGLPVKPAETANPPAADKTTSAPPADRGRVSMARQLGLGIARVVIDPGHGGRDPGAEGKNSNEADIVLDISLRLAKLLAKQPGVEVVLTRRTDVFVPLEERTAIANREQADLFLSIHANASRNENARGVESYYLNFATNPDAEAVAARENAASERTMNSLPDIIKAIALNNKLNESKDFASIVQDGLARRLRSANKALKNLGVKQAPFVVLIGAAMPSVLVEVSFLTNQREGQLLRTETYRQRIAESLADAIVRYKKALKTANVTAHE
jgi:N-acetylmuramoyl-L-alanine amidase